MKLYGTIESERASKGQGGNKKLEGEFFVGDKNDSKLICRVELAEITEGNFQAVVHFFDTQGNIVRGEVFNQSGYIPQYKREKGERRKGEKFCHECNEDGRPDKGGNCPTCGAWLN